MEELTTWSKLFFESLGAFGQRMMGALPGIIGAVLILLLGWLFARIVSAAVSRFLRLVKFDALGEKIQADQFLKKANIDLSPSKVVGKFVYWVLILLVIITASDTLGWTAVSEEISILLGYLPNLLIAIIFFIVGAYIASFLRDLIKGATHSLGISTGKVVSSFVFYLLMILVTLTALEQAGVDTTIITSNLLLILGTVLAAAAISYGIASKDLLANILAGFFSRRTFLPGQTIEIDGIRGEIVEISTISVTVLNAEEEKIVIPSHQLITSKVKIIQDRAPEKSN
jgi:small-conductance mechanosensitive channel